MALKAAVRRLLGRAELPAGFTGRLDVDEIVLASARLSGGGHVVVTSLGLWLPPPEGSLAGPGIGTEGSLADPGIGTEGSLADPGIGTEGSLADPGIGTEGSLADPSIGTAGPCRVGWHLVSKASWQNGAMVLVEAVEIDVLDGAVLIADLPPQRLRLAEPGRVPELVHARVTGSIRSRHHRELPASAGAPHGGAWFVQRKVPGRDGIMLQVRPDPGTDDAAVRQVAADVARTLGLR